MRALVLIHRWLGVAFCLLFAMWFASGLVMHFVPYPALEESERVRGLPGFSPESVAVTLAALDASSGQTLVVDEPRAMASARAHAQAQGMNVAQAAMRSLESHDQWTVANGFDAHRPLYRVALNDAADTMLYVSSVTGEVVLDTTCFERTWNWAGSVLHWIYPTALRQHWTAWDGTVWWLSLAAMIGALTGTALGAVRLNAMKSPFRGWMKWHHILGLGNALFVLTWIFSGWLSMDHGRLFSNGAMVMDDRMRIEGRPLSAPDMPQLDAITGRLREAEWFPFGGQVMMRVVGEAGTREMHAGEQRSPWLTGAHMAVAARALGAQCTQAPIGAGEAYPARSVTARAPAYRVICGETWFHIDGADGRVIEKLDASRRAYRWAFRALHTFDYPALIARPALRTLVIVVLCAAGFAFSVTGVVIGWRRLKRSIR